jgi:hypothetical protein
MPHKDPAARAAYLKAWREKAKADPVKEERIRVSKTMSQKKCRIWLRLKPESLKKVRAKGRAYAKRKREENPGMAYQAVKAYRKRKAMKEQARRIESAKRLVEKAAAIARNEQYGIHRRDA